MDKDGQFKYYFVLRDHLGNTRVTFSDLNNDDEIHEKEEIIQINNYYAFGLNMEGNWNGANGANKYQYNGKEWNDDFGLGWNDYGARWYDPTIARWSAIDPLVESYANVSPYCYVADNPITFIDPDGMRIIDRDGIVDRHKERLNQNIETVNTVLKMSGLSDGDTKALSEYKSQMESQLSEINTLEKSKQDYNVSYVGIDGGGGGTSYNEQTGAIEIGITRESTDLLESGVISHELKHGYQYEKGQISLRVKNDAYGVLYDISDETDAYNNQSVLEYGKFFTEHSWNDDKVKKKGLTMQPQAYQGLPARPININSEEGRALRKRTREAGKQGKPVKEVYKGWQKDYEKGKKQ